MKTTTAFSVSRVAALLVAAACLSLASTASAINLNFVDGNEGLPTDSPLANDQQLFAGQIVLLGGSFTVDGVTKVSVLINNIPSPFHTETYIVPFTTVVLSPGTPGSVNTSPTGSANLLTEVEQQGGSVPPLTSELTGANLQDIQVDLLGDGQFPVTFERTGIAKIPLGSFSQADHQDPSNGPVSMVVSSGFRVDLADFGFAQDLITDALIGSGAAPGVPSDFTTTYPVGSVGSLTARLTSRPPDIFDNNVIVNVGDRTLVRFFSDEPYGIDEQVTQAVTIPGTATLADLGFGDLQTKLNLDMSDIELVVQFQGSRTRFLNIDVRPTMTLFGESPIRMTATVNLMLNATLAIIGNSLQLQDSTPDVIVPEPQAVVLLLIGGLGMLPVAAGVYRRRRAARRR